MVFILQCLHIYILNVFPVNKTVIFDIPHSKIQQYLNPLVKTPIGENHLENTLVDVINDESLNSALTHHQYTDDVRSLSRCIKASIRINNVLTQIQKTLIVFTYKILVYLYNLVICAWKSNIENSYVVYIDCCIVYVNRDVDI